MPYEYETQKPQVFTKDGQLCLITMSNFCRRLLEAKINTVVANDLLNLPSPSFTTWDRMAVIDWMVELGILAISDIDPNAWQYRRFRIINPPL